MKSNSPFLYKSLSIFLTRFSVALFGLIFKKNRKYAIRKYATTIWAKRGLDVFIAKRIAAAFIFYYSWNAALEIVKITHSVHAHWRLFKIRKIRWWSEGISFGIIKSKNCRKLPFQCLLIILFATILVRESGVP